MYILRVLILKINTGTLLGGHERQAVTKDDMITLDGDGGGWEDGEAVLTDRYAQKKTKRRRVAGN